MVIYVVYLKMENAVRHLYAVLPGSGSITSVIPEPDSTHPIIRFAANVVSPISGTKKQV